MARASLRERFDAKVSRGDGCWHWTACTNSSGYGQLLVRGASLGAHRVSWALHCGEIPPGMHVLHRCDNRACVRPDHLFLGTNLDNVKDREAKGRNRFSRNKGERNPGAKLTRQQAEAIRRSGAKQVVLAEQYSVTFQMISRIKRNKAWKAEGTAA